MVSVLLFVRILIHIQIILELVQRNSNIFNTKMSIFSCTFLNCSISKVECLMFYFQTSRNSIFLANKWNKLWTLKYITCTPSFIFAGQHSHQTYIFLRIIKTSRQVNRKLEPCLFFLEFVICRSLSYFVKFVKWTLPCWFTACSQKNSYRIKMKFLDMPHIF